MRSRTAWPALALWMLASAAAQGAAGELVDMTAYWPQPKAGTTLIHRFDSGRFGMYRRQGDHFTLEDIWRKHTDPDEARFLILSGRWHYRIDPVRGMLEFQDDPPTQAGTPLQRGFELAWGRRMRVGQTLEHKVMFQGARGPFGYHQLSFVARHRPYRAGGRVYADVIQLRDVQVVCRDAPASEGSQDASGPLDCPTKPASQATYYLARGLGIIRLEDAVLDGVPNFVQAETVVKTCWSQAPPGQAHCR